MRSYIALTAILIGASPAFSEQAEYKKAIILECHRAHYDFCDTKLIKLLSLAKNKKRINAVPKAAAPEDIEPPQKAKYNRFYVRLDQPDLFYQGVIPDDLAGKQGLARGASVSYTGNLHSTSASGSVSHPLSATIQGLAGFNLIDTPFHQEDLRVMPSLFLQTDGMWDKPTKPTDYSYVKGGFNINASYLTNSSFLEAVLGSANAFYETDYFGQARIGGVTASVSPVIPSFYLGASPGSNEYVDGYWVARPELDYVGVQNSGHTLLVAHDYIWAGSSFQLYVFPFLSPINPELSSRWSPVISDRIELIGTLNLFQDLRSGAASNNYSASAQYTLSGCKTASAPSSATNAADKADPTNGRVCDRTGSSTISFEYDGGRDKELYVYQHKYLVKLSYKY